MHWGKKILIREKGRNTLWFFKYDTQLNVWMIVAVEVTKVFSDMNGMFSSEKK